MENSRIAVRQVVDWSAAAWAGLISGLIYLVMTTTLSSLFEIEGNLILRMTAAILLGGDRILEDPTIATLAISLLIHFSLSLIYAGVIAFVIHRWGFLVGLLGGGLLGVALYGINFYAFTAQFPWFSALRGWPMAAAHFIFGAAAGAIYEILEVEEFVPVVGE